MFKSPSTHCLVLILVFPACGTDTSYVGTGSVSDQRSQSPQLSTGDGVGCDGVGASQPHGCGAADHGPATSADATMATSSNTNASNGSSTPSSTNQNNNRPNNQSPPPTPTSSPQAPSSIVEFRIKAGTGQGAWNLQAEMITIQVGKTLRIINDDTIVHRLHTGGRPCAHQAANMAPGGSYDCKITQTFDPGAASPLYDHNVGQTGAPFWVKAVP